MLALQGCATARQDRDWLPYLAPATHVALTEDRFAVAPVSNWSYEGPNVIAQDYGEAAYDFASLRHVWFMLEPQPGSKLAAHTLLLFEFEGDRMLGLTIEARREQHEDYSAVRGIFNTFELDYVWASARDLLTRRAVMLEHEVFVYPLALTAEQQHFLLRRLLERTAALESHPRFYNTLFSNCTNELAKAVDLKWNPAFILTGTSDNYLFDEGIIPGKSGGASFAEVETRANLTAFIRQLNAAPPVEFDRLLLEHLRGAS